MRLYFLELTTFRYCDKGGKLYKRYYSKEYESDDSLIASEYFRKNITKCFPKKYLKNKICVLLVYPVISEREGLNFYVNAKGDLIE